MAVQLPNGRNYFATATGAPGVGYRLYTYVPGTSTPKATYTSSSGAVANTNPVVADARGEMSVYWIGSYDVVLRDASDNLIWGPERLEDSAGNLEDALADTSSASNGAGLLGYRYNNAYAQFTLGAAARRKFSFWDNLTDAEIADVSSGALTIDVSSKVQAMIDYVESIGGGVIDPMWGLYRLDSQITLKPGVAIVGKLKGEFVQPGCGFINYYGAGDLFYSPAAEPLVGLVFEGFFVDGRKDEPGYTGNCFNIEQAVGCTFRHVWWKHSPNAGFVIGQGATSYHNYFYNCYGFFNTSSGLVVQSDWLRAVDCHFDGNAYGIEFPNNAMCGSNPHIVRCHFEEWETAAILVAGNPAFGGNGDGCITDCVFYSRPYSVSDAAHGVFFNSTSAAQGCSGWIIRGNKFVYQSTYGPTKTGKYAIYFFGGNGGDHTVSDNRISGFDYGINVLSGSVNNILRGNRITNCNLGINDAAANTILSENVLSGNTADLTQTGATGYVLGNNFAVSPTLAATAYATTNNRGSRAGFTPVFRFGGTASGTFSTQLGRVEKYGHFVTCFVNLTFTNKGAATGTAEIDLPTNFPAANAQSPSVVYITNGSGITDTCFGYVNPSTGRFTMLQGAGTLLADTNFTNTSTLTCQFSYESS